MNIGLTYYLVAWLLSGALSSYIWHGWIEDHKTLSGIGSWDLWWVSKLKPVKIVVITIISLSLGFLNLPALIIFCLVDEIKYRKR